MRAWRTIVSMQCLLCNITVRQCTQMMPLQVNHISPQSHQFQDFIAKGDASEYADMFVDWDKLWPAGAQGSSLQKLLMLLEDAPCVMALLHCMIRSCLLVLHTAQVVRSEVL